MRSSSKLPCPLGCAEGTHIVWLVNSRTKILRALAAALLASEFFRPHMSIVLNMRERKAEKSNKRRVGRCLGFKVMAPVIGSIIICCRDEAVDETTIPRVDPGAAM